MLENSKLACYFKRTYLEAGKIMYTAVLYKYSIPNKNIMINTVTQHEQRSLLLAKTPVT